MGEARAAIEANAWDRFRDEHLRYQDA
jgi:hypothetical protein